MKVLFIGGTGNISTSVSKLCVKRGIELFLLNRGTTGINIEGTKTIQADINDKAQIDKALKGHNWDSVVNWIVYKQEEIERDIQLFKGKTKQYIFISSASAYQKPPAHPIITESTPLYNPFWEYSRDKIAIEERLNKAYREENFPITIVRPSLTFDTVIPVALGGWNEYNIIDRLEKGQKIIVHGDGTSLWVNTHSDDFAKGFAGVIGHQHAIGHAFHITTDEVLTWNQIYSALADAVGVEPNIIHIPTDFIVKCEKWLEGGLTGDKSNSVIFDNTKIKTFVPEFKAVIPFKEGVNRTVQWFEEDKSRQIINKSTNEMLDRIIRAYEKNKSE